VREQEEDDHQAVIIANRANREAIAANDALQRVCVKRLCNTILDRSGAPAYTWLLCLMYVCFLLNNTWCEAIEDIPIHMSMGSTNDISPLLCFHFWEPVYYKLDDSDFLSDSREKRGHFVGISESVGHAMTFKILTDDTLKVIH
jgi:hypothetical protein